MAPPRRRRPRHGDDNTDTSSWEVELLDLEFFSQSLCCCRG